MWPRWTVLAAEALNVSWSSPSAWIRRSIIEHFRGDRVAALLSREKSSFEGKVQLFWCLTIDSVGWAFGCFVCMTCPSCHTRGKSQQSKDCGACLASLRARLSTRSLQVRIASSRQETPRYPRDCCSMLMKVVSMNIWQHLATILMRREAKVQLISGAQVKSGCAWWSFANQIVVKATQGFPRYHAVIPCYLFVAGYIVSLSSVCLGPRMATSIQSSLQDLNFSWASLRSRVIGSFSIGLDELVPYITFSVNLSS